MRAVILKCGLLILPLALSGCGGGDFPTAPASGVVLCEGSPVPNAQVFFEPLQQGTNSLVGKPGYAVADAAGNFTLTTYVEGDGAVVGKHRVRVAQPHPERFPDFQCACETSDSKDVQQVEIMAGEMNDFTIELPAKAKTVKPDIWEQRDREDAKDAE